MLQEDKRRFPIAVLAGGIVVLLLVSGVVLLTHRSSSRGPALPPPLPFGPTEKAYTQHIHFINPDLKRGANFLNQEVTFVFGSVSNDGPRTVRQLELTIEFHDVFNQVVLRDTRRLPGPRASPLAPGEHRDFQFGYDHVPEQWNVQYPSIRVTGLQFE